MSMFVAPKRQVYSVSGGKEADYIFEQMKHSLNSEICERLHVRL